MSRAWKVPLSLYIHALKGVELARVRVVSSTVLGVKMIQHRDITGMSYFGHGGDLSHYSLPLGKACWVELLWWHQQYKLSMGKLNASQVGSRFQKKHGATSGCLACLAPVDVAHTSGPSSHSLLLFQVTMLQHIKRCGSCDQGDTCSLYGCEYQRVAAKGVEMVSGSDRQEGRERHCRAIEGLKCCWGTFALSR